MRARVTFAPVGPYVAAALAAGAVGALATTSDGVIAVVGIGICAALALLLERFGSAAAVGLLILGSLDALPGPNLETTTVANSITAQDVITAVLFLLLLYMNARGDYRRMSRTVYGRVLTAWAVAFLAWYSFIVLRTWVSTPVPLVHAVTFTRDLLYFTIGLVLLIGPLSDRRFRDVVLVTLGIGALVAGVAQSLAIISGASLSLFVHTYQLGESSGLTRLYTSASDVAFAALPLGFGLFLFGSSTRQRSFGAALGLVSLTAVVLGLTRAMYVGATVGLTFAALVMLVFTGGALSRVGRRQFLKALAAIVAASVALILYSPPSSSVLTGVSQRASTIVLDFTGETSTGAVQDASLQSREIDVSSIEKVLGAKWPIGLGALDPTYDYVSNVPLGNIRNQDVSLLGAVASIGVIGVAIYAFPLFSLLGGLLWDRWRSRMPREDDWLRFGGLAWMVGVAVASPTLGFFFIPAQVVGSSTMLALVAVLLAGRPER